MKQVTPQERALHMIDKLMAEAALIREALVESLPEKEPKRGSDKIMDPRKRLRK